MKLSVRNLQTVLAVTAIALAAGTITHRANADEWNKRTILTVGQTIQVRDTVLEPGRYVLRLLNSESDRHIVQIFNGDQSHLINTILAIPAERTELTGDTQFTFWETPPGTAKALRTWYYPGDNMGQEFPYPEHTHLLAMAESPALTPAPAPEPAPTAAVTTPEPEPSAPSEPAAEEPAPAPAAETPAPPPVAETDETPNPPAQAEPQAAPPAQPEELPKTASPYPLIGIAGVSLLALAGLLRLKRPA